MRVVWASEGVDHGPPNVLQCVTVVLLEGDLSCWICWLQQSHVISQRKCLQADPEIESSENTGPITVRPPLPSTGLFRIQYLQYKHYMALHAVLFQLCCTITRRVCGWFMPQTQTSIVGDIRVWFCMFHVSFRSIRFKYL